MRTLFFEQVANRHVEHEAETPERAQRYADPGGLYSLIHAIRNARATGCLLLSQVSKGAQASDIVRQKPAELVFRRGAACALFACHPIA